MAGGLLKQVNVDPGQKLRWATIIQQIAALIMASGLWNSCTGCAPHMHPALDLISVQRVSN